MGNKESNLRGRCLEIISRCPFDRFSVQSQNSPANFSADLCNFYDVSAEQHLSHPTRASFDHWGASDEWKTWMTEITRMLSNRNCIQFHRDGSRDKNRCDANLWREKRRHLFHLFIVAKHFFCSSKNLRVILGKELTLCF